MGGGQVWGGQLVEDASRCTEPSVTRVSTAESSGTVAQDTRWIIKGQLVRQRPHLEDCAER